jgi:hypothetical protein
LVPYSPSSEEEEEPILTPPVEFQDNLTWDDSIEVPFNIDEFLDDFLFNLDNSTVELVDLTPNTLQILDDFTGNPPPPTSDSLTTPLRTTEVEHSPDIVEQLGGGDNMQEGEGGTTLPDFQLSNRILNNIVVFTATFGDPFNTLMGGKFVYDPVEIVHAYVDKIRALLENQIQLWGGRDSIKVSIVLKVFI